MEQYRANNVPVPHEGLGEGLRFVGDADMGKFPFPMRG